MTKKSKFTHGGARKGAGAKSREERGLPPVKNTTVQVEPDVIAICRQRYGSIANALRYAATTASKPKPIVFSAVGKNGMFKNFESSTAN